MLDFRAILFATWLPLLLWAIAVGGATLSGYPGVICVTPLGWLLGFPVGSRVVQSSMSSDRARLLSEAGLAGAFLGFVQGLIFAIVLGFASPLGLQSGSAVETVLTALIAWATVGGSGAVVTGVCALFLANLQLRRS